MFVHVSLKFALPHLLCLQSTILLLTINTKDKDDTQVLKKVNHPSKSQLPPSKTVAKIQQVSHDPSISVSSERMTLSCSWKIPRFLDVLVSFAPT